MTDQSLEKVSGSVDIPLGRQWNCCSAAATFLGRLSSSFVNLQRISLTTSQPQNVRDEVLTTATYVVEKSTSVFKQLAQNKCEPGCCIAISVAMIRVSLQVLSQLTLFLTTEGSSTEILSALELINRRFDRALEFIYNFMDCNCLGFKDPRKVNFIDFNIYGLLGSPEIDPRNINNCCEAIISAFAAYFGNGIYNVDANLSTIYNNLERLEEVYFKNLKSLQNKCSNCCIGAAEGLYTSLQSLSLNPDDLANTQTFDILLETVERFQNEILQLASC